MTNPPKAEKMTVTVVDRFAMTQAWGNGGGGVVLRTVKISAHYLAGRRRIPPNFELLCRYVERFGPLD